MEKKPQVRRGLILPPFKVVTIGSPPLATGHTRNSSPQYKSPIPSQHQIFLISESPKHLSILDIIQLSNKK